MRVKTPWNSNPLAALLQVRAQRRPLHLPGPLLACALTGALAAWTTLYHQAHYPHYLVALFLALFFAFPSLLFQRNMAQLKALREGRCLEELLSVGLTPEAIADTFAWETWRRLAGLSLLSWSVAIVPTLWRGDPVLLSTGLFGLPVGLLLIGLTVYSGQALLVLSKSPSRLLREGLKLYVLTCLCLAPALHFFLYQNALLGLQLLLLGMLCLLGWTRRRAIQEWRDDLCPLPSTPTEGGHAWAAGMARFCSNPLLIRELQTSRGQSLWMWGLLPFVVVATVGLAIPGVVADFGAGTGFLMVWLAWRLFNFLALSDRAYGLLQKERQGGSWELLVQVGLGGQQFVKGWMLATCYRHLGWMAADLTGLLLLAHLRPEWMLPGATSTLVFLWAIGLWVLGLLLDYTAFLVGLSAPNSRSASAWAFQNGFLPGVLIVTALGELLVLLLVGLGWLPTQGSGFEFVWRQGIPCLALCLVTLHFAARAGSQLPQLLDPLRPASSQLVGLERLPQYAAAVAWVSWVLTSPTLLTWRETASLGQLWILIGLGAMVVAMLYLPLAWALYPLRSAFTLRPGRGLQGLLAGLAVAVLSAAPVVLAVESLHLYWMFNGEAWGGLEQTYLATDLPRVLFWAVLATWVFQGWRLRGAQESAPARSWTRLGWTALAGVTLAAGIGVTIRSTFPIQLHSAEELWWQQTQSRLDARPDPPRSRADFRSATRVNSELDLTTWTSSVETSLLMDRSRLQQAGSAWRSDDDWEVGAGWRAMIGSLETMVIDVPSLRQVVPALERSLAMQEELDLLDEEFVRRLGYHLDEVKPRSVFAWWPQALKVALVRRHLEQKGQPVVSAPCWADSHRLYRTVGYDQLNLSRAWRTLCLHRVEMALGKPEWPAVYVSPQGQVFRVTVNANGSTAYWLVDKSTAQQAMASWLVRTGDSSPGIHLYTTRQP